MNHQIESDTNTLTLASAIQKSKRSCSETVDEYTSVIAVVLNYARRSFNSTSAYHTMRSCVSVSDPSISEGTSIHIQLQGERGRTLLRDEIQIGDVVLFRNLVLREEHPGTFVFACAREVKGEEVVRLAKINAADGTVIYEDTLMFETDRTMKHVVTRLLEWYRQSVHCQRQNTARLSQLICQLRSLSQVVHCPGVTCNVVASVWEVTCIDTTGIEQRRGRKRRRGRTVSPSFLVLLKDGDSVIPFVDASRKFLSMFVGRRVVGETFHFRRVRATTHVEGFDHEIVFVPTEATRIEKSSMALRQGCLTTLSNVSSTQLTQTSGQTEQQEVVGFIREIQFRDHSLNSSNIMSIPDETLKELLMAEAELQLYSKSRLIVVADTIVLSKLCGDLHSNDKYQSRKLRLLRLLVAERVLLRWTLDETNAIPRVKQVALLNL